jgi:hypothetical protein
MGFRVPPGAVASLGGGAKQGSPKRIDDFNPQASKKGSRKSRTRAQNQHPGTFEQLSTIQQISRGKFQANIPKVGQN